MIGTVIGDIAGSRFEHNNRRNKQFILMMPGSCFPTDDTVMSLAVGTALIETGDDRTHLFSRTVDSMQRFGRRYPYAGYGHNFSEWIFSENPQPYNSWGNGSAMRAGVCGWAGRTVDEVLELARVTASTTHNHPEGIRGAQCIAELTFLARTGTSRDGLRCAAQRYYPLDFTIDGIRDSYAFDVSCQGSVPQAVQAFLESRDFEDAVRNAVSIGGDSDTIAAMAGSIAEAFYGVPEDMRKNAERFLDRFQLDALQRIESAFGAK